MFKLELEIRGDFLTMATNGISKYQKFFENLKKLVEVKMKKKAVR